jgi:hypothetical protein
MGTLSSGSVGTAGPASGLTGGTGLTGGAGVGAGTG